jgi:hypothetical protein
MINDTMQSSYLVHERNYPRGSYEKDYCKASNKKVEASGGVAAYSKKKKQLAEIEKVGTMRKVVIAGPASDNSNLISTIVDAVKEGSARIVANGKIIWTGMGNKSGFRGLLLQLNHKLHPGMKIEIQQFRSTTNRDHGTWITNHTAVVQ